MTARLRSWLCGLLLAACVGAAAHAADDTVYPYFPINASAQGFTWYQKYSDEPGIVEQARRMIEIGADAYKFQVGLDVGWQSWRTTYTDLPDLPRNQKNNIVNLVLNEPAYQTVFDLPFKFYVMWAYAMDGWYFTTNITQAELDREYQQLYDFARYLLTTYQGTGKVFLFGQWETDHVLLEGRDAGDPNQEPTPARLDAVRRWLRNRQKAVEDARNSLPDVTGVEVYNYVEVNAIQVVLDHPEVQRMVTAVLPEITMDLVSYSSYNATNLSLQEPERVANHLNCIMSYGGPTFTGAWPYGPPVFIGEFGLPGGYTTTRAACNKQSLKLCAAWGTPINLFWQVYTSTADNSDSALFQNDGTPNRDHEQLKTFNQRMITLKNARRVWCKRNPMPAETASLAGAFDTRSNVDLLRAAIDGSSGVTTNAEFLSQLFSDLAMADQIGEAWYNSHLATLNGGGSRYSTLRSILNSAQFLAAVPTNEYLGYLSAKVLNGPASFPNVSRRSQYEWALNHADFDADNLQYRLTCDVPEALTDKYSLRLAAYRDEPPRVTFEDLKQDADRFGPAYFINNGEGVQLTLTSGTELLELRAENAVNGTIVGIEYPAEGTIRWDTVKNRYLQAWIPYNGKGDATSVQFSVDGGPFSGEIWTNRIDGLTDAANNTRPALIDVNALAGLTPGVHELRLRLVCFTTEYSPPEDQGRLEVVLDWLRLGMPPEAETEAGVCQFVGPPEGELAANPPVLEWEAPAEADGLQYIVSLSRDPWFRGPTTFTVHDIEGTSYTPDRPLASGTWYWTVMPINSDGVAGICMARGIGGAGDWRAPYDYEFHSFKIAQSHVPGWGDYR